MKKGVKAAEAVQDVTYLRHGIACAFVKLSKLLDELKKQERAKKSYKKAQEWGYTKTEELSITTLPSLETAISIAIQPPLEASVFIAAQPSLKTTKTTQRSLKITKTTQRSLKTTASTAVQPPLKTSDSVATQPALCRSATIDIDVSVIGDFFVQDKNPPVIEYKLPEPDERLVNTHQLVYCLGLLKAPPSSDDLRQNSALSWVQAIRNNEDEQERLNTLTTNLVRAFIREELK
ncbi:hypothetical protein BGZ47_004706, partial [Haplosporangium gracile]